MSNSPTPPASVDDDHWEIYVTFVDDHPAVILVDIGISKTIPLPGMSKLAWVWVHIQSPDEEGFPSEDEDFRLNEVEDIVTDSITGLNARYVGRITSDGRREFYFYTDDFDRFQTTAHTAMESVTDYKFEIDEADDEEWTHYSNVLYPSAEDFQQIHNQNVINRLLQEGDSLTKPRRVDHFANFKTEEDREKFVAAATLLGFEAVSRPETQNTEFPFSVGFMREDAVDPETVDQVTFELYELAEQHQGEYDGWASPVVK